MNFMANPKKTVKAPPRLANKTKLAETQADDNNDLN